MNVLALGTAATLQGGSPRPCGSCTPASFNELPTLDRGEGGEGTTKAWGWTIAERRMGQATGEGQHRWQKLLLQLWPRLAVARLRPPENAPLLAPWQAQAIESNRSSLTSSKQQQHQAPLLVDGFSPPTCSLHPSPAGTYQHSRTTTRAALDRLARRRRVLPHAKSTGTAAGRSRQNLETSRRQQNTQLASPDDCNLWPPPHTLLPPTRASDPRRPPRQPPSPRASRAFLAHRFSSLVSARRRPVLSFHVARRLIAEFLTLILRRRAPAHPNGRRASHAISDYFLLGEVGDARSHPSRTVATTIHNKNDCGNASNCFKLRHETQGRLCRRIAWSRCLVS